MTKRQSRYWARWLMKRIPGSAASPVYNANEWWVVWGVDFLGTPQDVKEKVAQHMKAEQALEKELTQ